MLNILNILKALVKLLLRVGLKLMFPFGKVLVPLSLFQIP